MSELEGQKGAEKSKSSIGQIGQAGEDIRKSINSYADNMLGGNREHGGSGFHKDADVAGEKFAAGVGKVGQKVDEMKHKR